MKPSLSDLLPLQPNNSKDVLVTWLQVHSSLESLRLRLKFKLALVSYIT